MPAPSPAPSPIARGFGSAIAVALLALASTVTHAGVWKPIPQVGVAWNEGSPYLYEHAGAYDAVGDRWLLFGGYDATVVTNGVYTLSLAEPQYWRRLRVQGTPPAARANASTILDPVRRRLIVFGGDSPGPAPYGSPLTFYDDLWSLSLSAPYTWTQLTPANAGPSTRARHAAAYDPVRDAMIVYGGTGEPSVPANDVWTLSLSTLTWTHLEPTGLGPPSRLRAGLFYDETADRMLIAAGENTVDVSALELGTDPPHWNTSMDPAQNPTDSQGPSVAYDPAHRRVILFGGFVATYPYYEQKTPYSLSLGGVPFAWQAGTTFPSSDHVYAGQSLYDPLRGDFLYHGGSQYATGPTQNPLWQLESSSPSPFCGHADQVMAFTPGPDSYANNDANAMLGTPDGEFRSLGLGGAVTLRVDHAIADGPGLDFYVRETGSFTTSTDESYRTEVSADGVNFVVAGDGYGGSAGFDLASIGLHGARFVRITALPGDSDPAWFAGADIDGIDVVHCGSTADAPLASDAALQLGISAIRTDRIEGWIELRGDAVPRLELLDVAGRRCGAVALAMTPGRQRFDVSTSSLSSGVYFLRLTEGSAAVTRRVPMIH